MLDSSIWVFQALLTHNAKVYLAARNQEKAEQAIADLKQQTGHEAIFLQLDLQDLNSVKAAADTFLRLVDCSTTWPVDSSIGSEEKELHILFNNAYASNVWYSVTLCSSVFLSVG